MPNSKNIKVGDNVEVDYIPYDTIPGKQFVVVGFGRNQDENYADVLIGNVLGGHDGNFAGESLYNEDNEVMRIDPRNGRQYYWIPLRDLTLCNRLRMSNYSIKKLIKSNNSNNEKQNNCSF